MKPIIYLLLSFLLAGCAYDEQPAGINEPFHSHSLSETQFASLNNSFAFKLFRAIKQVKQDSNIFISPFSVSMALGMALNGANGETFQQMRSVLGFEHYDLQTINQTYQNYFKQLTASDPVVMFKIANSVWYDRNFEVLQSFTDVTRQFFNAQINKADFSNPATVDSINAWVSRKTNGKINSILNYIPRDALMYLINAIYFKGSWQYAFDSKFTQDWMFKTLTGGQTPCKMMFVTKKFPHYANSRLEMVQLPYGNGNFNLAVIVPNQSVNFDDFVNSFDLPAWRTWLRACSTDSGTIGLPRTKIGFSMVLNNVLKKMGMPDAFNPAKADFSHLTPQKSVFMSIVKHKTFVEINEQGTEAAGVTLVGFSRSANTDFFELVADRPFLLVIFEKKSQAILFMGQVTDLSK